MTLAARITALAQAFGADIKTVLPKTADLAYSFNPARYSLPSWLPCDGSLILDANMPASLQPYLARAYNATYSLDSTIESAAAAPVGVADMTNDIALFRMAASPFLIPMFKSAVGFSYTRDTLTSNPAAAIVAAAIGATTVPNLLAFTAASGGAFYARRISSNWSISNVSTIFAGKAFVGVVYGADSRFYALSTTAPFLFSIGNDVPSGTLQEEPGASASPVGLGISPNKKYMVAWYSAAPFVTLWEYDGTKYRSLGSPPFGAASFTRVEVSDTGVVVGKPSAGSIMYVCSLNGSGALGGMVQTTVDAATAWGITDDGRYVLTWVASVLKSFPIANDGIGTGTNISAYVAASHGTLAGRFGIRQGRFLASSSVSGTGFGLAMNTTTAGWIAPRIRYGFMKA